MKIERKLSISIQNPCEEKPEDMTPTACGSFCHLCRKEVIDFSAMTDTEILSMLHKNTSLCGSFRPEQLDRDIVESYKVRQGFPFRIWAGILSFVAMLQFRPANAQPSFPSIIRQSTSAVDSNSRNEHLSSRDEVFVEDDTVTKLRGELIIGLAFIDTTDAAPTVKGKVRYHRQESPGFFRRTWLQIKRIF